MLDASLPYEIEVIDEVYLPPEDREPDDWIGTNEEIDVRAVHAHARAMEGNEPDIPLSLWAPST